ncbi:S2-RNase [Pyrus ussuriensis x Pyrus communis]|uniref:S2-RNase n=1 Tax=Pyrus ussuriensis x Pyrus communis TaxID=2448454 RepID=A0A5N5GW07_9ROSA|nr:S2-RNase [Pyrus ussuriensis x Pyrus communis]
MTHPLLMIQPLADQIALPCDDNGLQNTNYVRELLNAAIAHADFKGACTSFKDFMMRCYESLCEVPKFLSSISCC